MPSTFVHFETLRARVASHPNTAVFKLPKADALGGGWIDVSYMQFQTDIERMAKFWFTKLSAQDIPSRSVVGIWLRGYTYADVITIYAVSRAGFIPQMFEFQIPNTRTIFELLNKYDGKAIIHHPAKTTLLESQTSLPCHVAADYLSVSDSDVADLELLELPEAKDEDLVFINHTSGSMSGTPKLVPRTNKLLSTMEKKGMISLCAGDFESQDVYMWTGSFANPMAINLLQFILYRAACLTQPARSNFDSRELASMIREANVNRTIYSSAVLRGHLENARAGTPEPDLLALLKTLRQVTYVGAPFPTELEDWAVAEGIPITSVLGSTECGQLFTSTIGDRRLKTLPSVSFRFVPVGPISTNGTEYSRLLELWVLPDPPDATCGALCELDGAWHSGDLFEEVEEGKYLFRGRDDDWIKTRDGQRVDTLSIEDNVYTTCSDIVADCVVVGCNRPFPALFVERRASAATSASADLTDLKHEILKRTSNFHTLKSPHERIQDVRMIKAFPHKSLPRLLSKGTIIRRAVEQEYADDIEAMYASFCVEKVVERGE